GIDEPRRDRVHGDAARRYLVSKRFGHADHPGLGSGIIGLACIAGQANHRGDPDNAAEAPTNHSAYGGTDEPESRGEIYGEHLIPILVLESHEDIVPRNGGLIYQNFAT